MASKKIRSKSRGEIYRHQKRRRRTFFIVFLLVVVSSVFWGWPLLRWSTDYLLSGFDNYRTRTIRVSGAHRLDESDIINTASILEGTPLFQVSLRKVGERLRAHPWIRTATAIRRLPDTIELQIEEREPAALVSAHSLLSVTSDSILLPLDTRAQSWNLPLLRLQTQASFTPGDSLRDTQGCTLLSELASLKNYAPRLCPNLSELYWNQGEMWAVFQKGNVEVRLGRGTGEIGWKSLEKLLAGLEAQQRLADVETIDLRFTGRIIVSYRDAS